MLVLALLISVIGYAAHPETVKKMNEHVQKAYELYDVGSYKAAQSEFLKARKLTTSDELSERLRIDYHIAACAGKVGDKNAMTLLKNFLLNYPNSAYANDVRFDMANLLYQEGDYEGARSEYLAVSRNDLRVSQQDEYNFKMGHSFFMHNDMVNANSSFMMVNRDGAYGVHAKYYLAYIDYIGGRYTAAKQQFLEIANNTAYSQVVPFYLLQIEFLEGNYDYVLQHGDQLLAAAKGEREAEIARIMGEAWFHKEDYGKALDYMARYRAAGGVMGRAENYLVGYSQYVRNDVADAIQSLVLVVGPDDKLTQNAAYHLGGCYLRSGDKHKAMQSFSMASGAEYDPMIREDALFNYGKLQYELGGGVFNEAINILGRYIDEYPDSERVDQAREFLIAAYYNSRNYEAAYDAIKLIPNPDNNIRTAYQKIAYFRALEYYNAGELDTAYRLLDESLRNRFNPKYTALTQYWRGEVLYKKGEYKQAIPLFREYISLSPSSEKEHTIALYNLGYCYFNQEQWRDARGWFDRFLSNYSPRDGFKADALNRRGDTNFALRQFNQAMTDYDAVAAMDDDQKYYAQFQRAMIQGLTGSRNSKVETLRSIISRDQGDYVGDAMYELGRTYMVMERFPDAATILKRYIEEYPTASKNLDALSDLGLAYQNMNNNSTALRYYQMLAEKAPNSPQARDAMLAAKSIYVDMNDIDGYFAFARGAGTETDMGVLERDSLSFVAAERIYMTSSDRGRIISSLKDYLDKFPRGAYRANTLYYISEHYVADRQFDNAILSLKELSDMHYNSYTVRGLERLAPLCFEQRQYANAAEAYQKLGQTAVNPETKAMAYSGYVKSVVQEGDDNKIVHAADEVLAVSGLPSSVIREAKFAKAQSLSSQGHHSVANGLYKELATESQSIEGAQSTYYVVESMFDAGDINGAEQMILKFAEQKTPHAYWLGKAFLILGDIYAQKGDNFQARATLQSIVDGYTPANDGVVDAAKERINRLDN